MFRLPWFKVTKRPPQISESQSTTLAGSLNLKSPTIKIITDEPTVEDALDFDSYSKKLADIIRTSTPRFAIGVFGGWGTGKTSLMKMIEKNLKDTSRGDTLVVWFDAWRYEKEKYLAVIPFIRTIKLELENTLASQNNRLSNKTSKTRTWHYVTEGLERTFEAFINSTSFNFGIGSFGSTQVDLRKFTDIFKAEGSMVIDNERILYHKHITDYLVESMYKIKKDVPNFRIVVFIDDLDRCTPEKSLEVLESIKTFFDIEGFVYVIGMDSNSVDSIVRQKYGENSGVNGLDYLQKIVQLPFQIPHWKEEDISSSISKIITKGLKESDLIEEFEKYKNLIVKAVQLNPREVKRFINNVILAEAVFDKPIDELIVVQALNFRHDWNKFLELITPDERRKAFLIEYGKLKEQSRVIANEKELAEAFNEEMVKVNPAIQYSIDIHKELLRQNTNALKSFLDAGAAEILMRIEKMEEHRRALDTTKHKPIEEKTAGKEQSELIKLLYVGKVNEFNRIRAESYTDSNLDLRHANLTGANLTDANLSDADLSDAKLTRAILYRVNLAGANLSDADLSGAYLYRGNLAGANLSGAYLYPANLYRGNLSGANLSGANLSGASLYRANLSGANLYRANLSGANLSVVDLSDANLSDANLSDATLESSIIMRVAKYDNLRCSNADFVGAIINDERLVDYLISQNAINVPSAVRNKKELEKKLEKLQLDREIVDFRNERVVE